jgi:hypothetical protein
MTSILRVTVNNAFYDLIRLDSWQYFFPEKDLLDRAATQKTLTSIGRRYLFPCRNTAVVHVKTTVYVHKLTNLFFKAIKIAVVLKSTDVCRTLWS